MIELFSSRETAIGIWFLIFLILILAMPKIRESALNVIKSAITPKLSIPFIVLLIYTTLIFLLSTSLPNWNSKYIKDMSVWTLFAGVPIFYGSISNDITKGYYAKYVTDNLKFVSIIEFIISSFTFNIVIEIIIIPVLLIFSIADLMSTGKAKSIIVAFQSIIGLSFLCFSILTALSNISSINNYDMLYSFLIPIAMSLLFIPISYLYGIYAKYEILFLNMNEPDNREIRMRHRIKAVRACGISFRRIREFNKCTGRMNNNMNEIEFDKVIAEFKEAKKSHC